jgi:hypothetical protein
VFLECFCSFFFSKLNLSVCFSLSPPPPRLRGHRHVGNMVNCVSTLIYIYNFIDNIILTLNILFPYNMLFTVTSKNILLIIVILFSVFFGSDENLQDLESLNCCVVSDKRRSHLFTTPRWLRPSDSLQATKLKPNSTRHCVGKAIKYNFAFCADGAVGRWKPLIQY